MISKIFVAFRNLHQIENGLQKISYEGKEYYGYFLLNETVSIQELKKSAEALNQDVSQVLLIPMIVFG